MKLWILERKYDLPENDNPWKQSWDTKSAFIVRAQSAKAARQLAQKQGGDETRRPENMATPWLDPKYTTCKELTLEGEAAVILDESVDG